MRKVRSGSALVIVLSSMAIIAVLIAVVANVTSSNVRLAQRNANRTTAVAYADGVVESLYDQWRQAMISVNDATDRVSGLSNASLAAVLAAPTNTELPPPAGVTLESWSVQAVTPLLAPTTRADGRPVPENGTASSLRVRLTYLATATVSVTAPGGSSTVKVQRSFVRGGRNIFDHFFFGTQENVEFHPGPDMYVDGSVYIGGNLYTAHDSLHLMKETSFLGNHELNYRPTDARYGTNPTIDDNELANNWDVNNPPHRGTEQKLLDTVRTSLDPNFLDDPTANDTDSDGNQNNNGYHEIIEEPVAGTDPLQLDIATSERFSVNADYRIYVDASNAVTIYKGTSATPMTSGAEYTALLSAVQTNTALKDVRQADNVRLVTLNVDTIRVNSDNGTIVDSVGAGDGLLLYVRDTSVGTSVSTQVVNSSTSATTSVTSTRSRGVKLVNGGRLPNVGLTVVSPNAVYVQGDYNSGKTSTQQPPSNTTSTYTPPLDTPSPVVSGYERKPSAIVGDAVNVLSNSWNDANSLLSQSNRVASNTTINTAIVAGNVPTTTSSYSGGIENFSRFHENWSGRYFTIYGSQALLYASQEATRAWSYADYSAPNRRWYYDSKLRETNPPGFRVARLYERGRWTLR